MAWDKDQPAGSTKLRLADDAIRTNNAALEDALGRDHNFPGTISVDAGEHTRIAFYAPISSPTAAANKCFLFPKDAGGKVELHWLDEDDNELQITSAGFLVPNDIPSGEIILFEKDTAVTGYTLQTDVDDMVPFISKGSVEGGEEGGTNHSTGTWTQPDHTLTIDEIPPHTHNYRRPDSTGAGGGPYSGVYSTQATGSAGGGGPHNHGAAWRPAARVFTRQERD